MHTTGMSFKAIGRQVVYHYAVVSRLVRKHTRSDEGLETQKYSLYPKEHPANCSLRWRLSNGLGCISHDCKLDLVTIQGNLTGDQYIRDVLQPVVVPHFRQPPTSYKARVYG